MTEAAAFPALSAYETGFDPPRNPLSHPPGVIGGTQRRQIDVQLRQQLREELCGKGNCLHCPAVTPVLHYICPLHSTKSPQSLNVGTDVLVLHGRHLRVMTMKGKEESAVFSVYLGVFIINTPDTAGEARRFSTAAVARTQTDV